MQIKELGQHIGEEVNIMAYLTEVKETTKGTNRWADLMVSDKTGSASFKMWSEAMEGLEPSSLTGKVCLFKGLIDLYKGSPGVNVMSVALAEEETYAMGDFFPSLDEEEEKRLMQRCKDLIEEVKNDSMRALLSQVAGRFLPKVAKKMGGTSHHAYIGGLLAHMVQVAEVAKAAARTQCGPYSSQVDNDLVVAGALLHDIGKLTTLDDVPGKLTERGFYLDAQDESLLYIAMYNKALGQNAVKNLGPLNHIVLACRKECKPRTLEAIIVSNADQMSNQMDSFGLAFADGEPKDCKGDSVISYSREMNCYLMKRKGD